MTMATPKTAPSTDQRLTDAEVALRTIREVGPALADTNALMRLARDRDSGPGDAYAQAFPTDADVDQLLADFQGARDRLVAWHNRLLRAIYDNEEEFAHRTPPQL
jgi:hypothetical protein